MKNNNQNLNLYIDRINSSLLTIRKSSKDLFKTFTEAYNNLSSPVFESEFLPALDLDKSTINKMKKICKSDAIMSNLDKLPSSWGTLSTLTALNEKEIRTLCNEGKIHTKSTKNDVIALRETTYLNEDEYENLVSLTESGDAIENRNNLWALSGAPEFTSSVPEYNKPVTVHFLNDDDRTKFMMYIKEHTNKKITSKTNSVRYEK